MNTTLAIATAAAASVLALVSASLSAQTLVRDLNQSPRSGPQSQLRQLVSAGSRVFFVARRDSRPAIGEEIFVSSGAPGDLRPFRDSYPGPADSSPTRMLTAGDTIYWAAAMDSLNERELLTYNTVTGSLRQVYTTGSSLISGFVPFAEISGPVVIDRNQSLFVPWNFNGSVASNVDAPAGNAVVQRRLVFAITSPTTGTEPWVIPDQGRASLLADLEPGGNSSPRDFIQSGSLIYFSAQTSAAGRELWRTDGTTAGTAMVADIAGGAASSNPRRFAVLGQDLIFVADDGVSGSELWRVRGTAAPVLVADIAAGGSSSNPEHFVNHLGKLYFAAADASQDRELWSTDGSTAGTRLEENIATSGSSNPRPLASVGTRLYLQASPSGSPFLMEHSGGTSSALSPSSQNVLELVAGGTGVEVVYIVQAFGGPVLWSSAGTTATTRAIGTAESPVGSTESSAPQHITPLGPRVVFSATTRSLGREPYISDGTSTGTTLLGDLAVGTPSSDPAGFAPFGDTLVFAANDGSGRELFRTDGTAAGTGKIVDLNPGGGSDPAHLTEQRGWLYLAATDAQLPQGLHRTDGSPAGTTRLSNTLQDITAIVSNGRTLFIASNGTEKLWVSDGSISGTSPLTITLTAAPTEMIAAGRYVYFLGTTNAAGAELWRSDGTNPGTQMVIDLVPGPNDSNIRDIQPQGEGVFFRSRQLRAGVYFSDGTAGGTAPVHSAASSVRSLAVTPERLLYGLDTDNSAVGLKSSNLNGSNETLVVSYNYPTNLPYEIEQIIAHGGSQLYTYVHRENRPNHNELWITEGLSRQADQITGIELGFDAAQPPVLAGGNLFFSAANRTSGLELFVVDGRGAGQVVGTGCAAQTPPRLRSRSMTLGASPRLFVDAARPFETGLLCIGASPAAAIRLPGSPCRIHVDIGLPIGLRPITTNPVGEADVRLAPLPTNPVFLGCIVASQAVITSPSNPPLSLDFSNGVVQVLAR